MRRLLAVVCLAAVFASIGPAGAADRAGAARLAIAVSLPASATATIDRLVEDGIRAGDFPGAVVVIASSEHLLYRKAYGVRSDEPRPVANDPGTIYEFASVTKPAITATAVMALVERGMLRTSDRVARWIPEFAANGKHDVTIAQLLTHTAGMPPVFKESDYGADRPTILRHAYEAPLRFAPGSGNEYSNVAFIVLTEVIARASGTATSGSRARRSSHRWGCATRRSTSRSTPRTAPGSHRSSARKPTSCCGRASAPSRA